LSLAAVPDEPPQVNVQLQGIGTAITAKARLPVAGDISDDYGVGKLEFDLRVDDQAPRPKPLAIEPAGRAEPTVDEALEVEPLGLTPKQKLHFSVRAIDTFDLGDSPNVGASQRYVLEVVTAEQLRAILEARELQLRRRFETIIQDVTDARNALARIE